jgi:replicative DNA helicase
MKELGTTFNNAIGVTYISNLIGSNLRENVQEYAEIIKECSNNRKIIHECKIAIERAYKNENPKDIINTLEKNIQALQTKRELFLSSCDLMGKTLEHVTESFNNGGGLVGMPCGFKSIDLATDGFIKQNVVVIAGRPSMGKTLLALEVASGLAKENKVAMFELEMDDISIGIRQLSSATHIKAKDLQRGELDESDWAEISKAMNHISKNKLWVDNSSTLTIYEIKNRCRQMKIKEGLDVVIIDHIGLLDIPKDQKNESRTQQIGEITRQAKIMAKELNVCVILLSQLSRGVESRTDKRPIMSDLRDSGNIEQDADVVMFVYRDEYYNPSTQDKNVIELIIAKQRNGSVGDVRLYCNLATQTIYDKMNIRGEVIIKK